MIPKLVPEIPSSAQRYDITKSYAWNYDHAPEWPTSFRGGSGGWKLAGVDVASPVGVAAGPLLNGRWVLHFASLGFDVVTYKTVRSQAWPCYDLPNLQPVPSTPLSTSPREPVSATRTMTGSWAVSFGMPSQDPEVWRRDVEETRRRLPAEKKLSVSVVATPQPTWTLDDVANDYARCALWAVESGADFVELNFSCPNVVTRDGQLFQNPNDSAIVAARARDTIGSTPLLLKLGHVDDPELVTELVTELAPYATALVMINCIPATVRNPQGLLFQGSARGIAGDAIRGAVPVQLERFQQAIQRQNSSLELVAVGGLRDDEDVRDCLGRGASGVQVATAIMWP